MGGEPTMNYPWDEVISDFFEERGITFELTEEQWEQFAKTMDDCHSEMNEQASYGRPSMAEVVEMNYAPERRAHEAEVARITHISSIYEKQVLRDHNAGPDELHISNDQIVWKR